jgi:signal transduction histidine kinase
MESMKEVGTTAPRSMSLRGGMNLLTAYTLAVVVPVLTVIGFQFAARVREVDLSTGVELVIWTALVAAVELLPAPAWGGVQVSLGFPLLAAVAITYPPGLAAVVALIGSFDPRELKRELGPLRALFNRSQIALAVFAASGVFHALSSPDADLVKIIPAALVATVVDYAINIGLVVIAVSLIYRMGFLIVLRQLSRGKEFLVSYVGLGLLGTVLAKLFSLEGVGFWSVITVLAPLLFARQMFLRSHALEQAHKELQEREQVLRQLSNTMAEERADERIQIAGYLHDDLAQILFRLSIQVDVARRMLDKRELETLATQLEKIRESKQDTSDRIRALIRDLHRSPLGAKGLAEALESFTDEVGRDSGVGFHRDVEEIEMPAPIALLLYHVAREGVMNALKHAKASDVWIGVHEEDDDIVLELRDNGVGFDTSAPGPEGHFGMAMMRERAQVGGGRFEVESAPGAGTTITVRFPAALLQREPQDPTAPSDPTSGNGSVTGAAGSTEAASRHTVSA